MSISLGWLAVAAMATGFGAFVAFLLLVMIRQGWARSREVVRLQGGPTRVLRGEVDADRDGLRDPRVTKGLVYDKKTGRYVRQGKLADEDVVALVGR